MKAAATPARLGSLDAFRGFVMVLMAGFYALIDGRGWRGWAFPLVVVGMNSIAMYCLVHLLDGFIINSLKIHLGQDVFKIGGDTFAPLWSGAAALAVLWLILFWMHRRKLYLRV